MTTLQKFLCLFFLLPLASFPQGNQNNVQLGLIDASASAWKFPTRLFAALPAAASSTGQRFTVTDCLTSACTAGSGTLRQDMVSTGSAWIPAVSSAVVTDPSGNALVSPTVPGGQGGATISPTSGVLDGGGQVYNVQAFGILPNGTDYSTQFAALLTTVYNAGGGQIYFPAAIAANKYRFNSCFTLPNDGASPKPTQPPLRIFGAGSSPNSAESSGDLSYGGSTLDFRCTSGTAWFDTRGKGLLEIDHLSITNGNIGGATVPMVQTTNTIVRVHDNLFLGQANLGGNTSTQDAIYLGGTTITEDGSATAAFQGYGTVIEKNNFNRIRRGVYLRTYANGVVIRDNTWWNLCGAADATTAALDFNGGPSVIVGGMVAGNLFETYNYSLVINLVSTLNVTFSGNNFYDASAQTTYYMQFDAASSKNMIYEGAALVSGGFPTGGAYHDQSTLHNSYFSNTVGLQSPTLAALPNWIPFPNASGQLVTDTAPNYFLYDPVNHRLGLGVPAPAARLEVGGNFYQHGGSTVLDTLNGYTTNKITFAAHIVLLSCTIASLPSAPVAGEICYFTDAATTIDCTVGSGTAKSLCIYNGSAWAKP
jgi:hypothetical protein